MSASHSGFMPNNTEENSAHNDSFNAYRIDKYSRFLIYLKNAIQDISSGVSEEQYVNYLRGLSIIKKSKSVPGKMQKKMKASLFDSLLTEIQEIINEENIKTSLLHLEKLIDESMLDEGQELWRPNGNVKDHMRSHLMEVKQKHKDELEKKVREKEQDTECILRKVIRMRTQVRSLGSRLHVLKSQCNNCSVMDRIDEKIVNEVEDLY